MQVKQGSYTGNAADARGITGIGFQPDVVLVKANQFISSGRGGQARSSSMSGDLTKPMNGTALIANLVQSLDADGFTIGDDVDINTNLVVYHYLALKALAADLAVGTYTGDGGASQAISGVGFAPNVVFIFPDSTTESRWYSSVAGDSDTIIFSGGNNDDAINSMDADGFTVNTGLNTDTITYHYVVIKNASGIFELGSYTGDAADNRSLTAPFSTFTGITPTAAFIGKISGVTGDADPIHLDSMGPTTDSSMMFVNAGGAANLIQQLISGGVEIGSDNRVNASTATFSIFILMDGDSGGGAVERSTAGTLPAMAGVVTRILQALRAPVGTLPAMAGVVTRLLLALRATVGTLPAPAGVVTRILLALRATTGVLPAMAGVVTAILITARDVAGTLPAMAGVVTRLLSAFRAPAGVLPAMAGALSRTITVAKATAGTLPGPAGALVRLLLGLRATAGTLPAMIGTVAAEEIGVVTGSITLTLGARSMTLSLVPKGGLMTVGAYFPLEFDIYFDESHQVLTTGSRSTTVTLEPRP